jgi:ribokinase
VAVVGSANLDVVMAVPHFAGPGETLLAEELEHAIGGKGLNQAVAAARAASCAFVGCVGEDEAGTRLLDGMARAGVVTDQVRRVGSSGQAFIEVTPDGENSIVVVPLANRLLSTEAVTSALDELTPPVVLAQLEIPLEAVESAAAWSAQHGSRFVLNASPVRDLPLNLLSSCDPLLVNASEAGTLLTVLDPPGPGRGDDVADAARRLTGWAPSVVVTEGTNGAYVCARAGDVTLVPTQKVAAVDTTGAGDEFAGALVAALARGEDLERATAAANAAAAVLVQTPRSQR